MGSAVEILTVDGPHAVAIGDAVQRLELLEQRWSRFIASSEVARLNRHAGGPVVVSADTLLLVQLACRAWRRTDGRFDPTVLGAVEALGYTSSFDRLGPTTPDGPNGPVARPPGPTAACGAIVIDRARSTVTMPRGIGFDPGGIGKGLAADLVGQQLNDAGVSGGCVNVGGDLRVWGSGPGGRCWRIGVEGGTVEVTDVGVATSGNVRRSWLRDGRPVHHLVDPTTAESTSGGPSVVTVVAPAAWQAETCATALMVPTSNSFRTDAERWGVRAFVS
ncbi:MAG: FAD:protein FMN transferase [Actinomycetota bacterium]